MNYERINWLNEGETGAKPINKTNLNKMDEAIANLCENTVLDNLGTVITDCNDTSLETGFYYATSTGTANIPYTTDWNIQVIKRSNNVITQIAYKWKENEMYIRQYNSSGTLGWKEWKKIIIEDDFYYKDGDTYTTSSTYMSGVGAFVTTSATAILFDIILPKKLSNISSVTINELRIRARSISGTYLLSGTSSYCDVFTNKASDGTDLSASCTSATAQIVSENQLRIVLVFSDDVYELNNCPVSLEYRNMSLKFNSTSTASEE